MPEDVGRSSDSQPPARKRRPPLVTRDQVIETAYRLVDDEGPPGLSMRRLAGALHVSLPTVYTAIDSREALVVLLLDRLFDEITVSVTLDGTRPADATADEDLGWRGRALLDWSRRKPNLTAFLLEEEVGVAVVERAVRSADTRRRAAALDLLGAIVGSARSADIDPVAAVMMIVAEARCALWLARQEALTTVGPERWMELGCRNVARSLQALAESSPVRQA